MNRSDDDGHFVITRNDPITPRRITYLPSTKHVIVEKQVFRTSTFLTRLHARVGYATKSNAAKIWAVGVDLSIVATILWIFSGFWMWWELQVTRRWGVFFMLLGIALFGMFLLLA